MNPDVLKVWLRKKKSWGFAQHLLFGLLVLLGGIFVLFLTFWFTYAVIWIGMSGVSAVSDLIAGKKLHLSHGMRLVCAGVFIVLLFVQHFRTSPDYWGQYEKHDYPEFMPVAAMQGGLFSMGILLAYPGTSANMIADLLLIGPRLVTGAGKMIARGFRLRRIDENGCAELLAFLHSRSRAVPYDELKSAGWEKWFGQLLCIDGVLSLQEGFSLSTELRSELNQIYAPV